MCGRYVATSPPEELAKYFGAAPPATELPPNYNVAPTNDVYAVTADADGNRSLATFHWGLVPFWAKEQKVGYRMINARAETVATSNAYRKAFRERRCLLPADGFFEWKVVGRDEKGKARKQPYYVHRSDHEPLAMAAVWERWRGPDKDWEEPLHSVAVVTTQANRFMMDIHDRMPVFLPPSAWDRWLDPEVHDVAGLQSLLVPAPEGLLTAHPVDTKVGNVRNRGPELLEPVPAA
jgi:putative SOS response-associated peptidase YedK